MLFRSRRAFIVLLALVVAVSIKAVGGLLISAFLVIPACAARLVSRQVNHYVALSAGLGAGCAVLGLVLAAWLDLPSGPAVVVVQLVAFLVALALASWRSGG